MPQSLPVTILRHAKLGQHEQAIKVYCQMRKTHVEADGHVFVAVLKACAGARALPHGRLVHGHLVERGFEVNVYVANTLIDMYGKCGRLKEASKVFHQMPQRDVVTWNAIVSGYAQLGHGEEALLLLQRMQQEGMEPDKVTCLCTLKACSSIASLDQGKMIHRYISESGWEVDLFIGSTLVDLYAKCGNLMDAQRVFANLPEQNVVTWNAIIAGCVQNRDVQAAFQLFAQMQQEGMIPNQATFACILKACCSTADQVQGKQFHAHIVACGFESNAFVVSALIHMYATCGSIEEAQYTFDNVMKQDTVMWSALIAGYVHNGHNNQAISVFRQMRQKGMHPNQAASVCILKACTCISALEQGKLIHACIVESGLEAEVYIANTLINMYAKCGSPKDARWVFNRLQTRDVISWNALIAGYAQYFHYVEAFRLFQRMQQEGMEPDNVTILSMLKAYSCITDQGNHIHSFLDGNSLQSNAFIGNALIDMYGKGGSLDYAFKMFVEMPKRDAVTWSALIAGFVEHGHFKEAFVLFQQMQQEGMKPNQGALVCILKACASEASVDQGKLIHVSITESGFESDVAVGNTLINMYAKCGSLEDACMVFNRLQNRDEVTWSVIIAGFAHDNNYELALHYFEAMQRDGLMPNDVTFICLLSACSHFGLVEEGCYHFSSMANKYSIAPALDHYNCVIDLLGRAKQLNKAEDLLISMPFHPNFVGWTSLLGHCRIYGDVELGRRSFDHLVSIHCSNAAVYVLMADIYGDAGLQEDADRIVALKKSADLWKKPGQASIQIDGHVHDFIVGDRSHPQISNMHSTLKSLTVRMKGEGYMPDFGLNILH